MAVVKQVAPPEPVNPYYPRWIPNPDPNAPEKLKNIIVKDHIHHSAVTGKKFNPDATEAGPMPPTFEIVLKAGYAEGAAKRIVFEEEAKYAAGEKPYGDKEPTHHPYPGDPTSGDDWADEPAVNGNANLQTGQVGVIQSGQEAEPQKAKRGRPPKAE
jgi:hypothetical protein